MLELWKFHPTRMCQKRAGRRGRTERVTTRPASIPVAAQSRSGSRCANALVAARSASRRPCAEHVTNRSASAPGAVTPRSSAIGVLNAILLAVLCARVVNWSDTGVTTGSSANHSADRFSHPDSTVYESAYEFATSKVGLGANLSMTSVIDSTEVPVYASAAGSGSQSQCLDRSDCGRISSGGRELGAGAGSLVVPGEVGDADFILGSGAESADSVFTAKLRVGPESDDVFRVVADCGRASSVSHCSRCVPSTIEILAMPEVVDSGSDLSITSVFDCNSLMTGSAADSGPAFQSECLGQSEVVLTSAGFGVSNCSRSVPSTIEARFNSRSGPRPMLAGACERTGSVGSLVLRLL